MSPKERVLNVPVCTQCGSDGTRIRFKDGLSLEGKKTVILGIFYSETKVLYSVEMGVGGLCLSECVGAQPCVSEPMGASLNTRHVGVLVVTLQRFPI